MLVQEIIRGKQILCTQRLLAEVQCTHLVLVLEASAVSDRVTSTQCLNGPPEITGRYLSVSTSHSL